MRVRECDRVPDGDERGGFGAGVGEWVEQGMGGQGQECGMVRTWVRRRKSASNEKGERVRGREEGRRRAREHESTRGREDESTRGREDESTRAREGERGHRMAMAWSRNAEKKGWGSGAWAW